MYISPKNGILVTGEIKPKVSPVVLPRPVPG